jgi:hypothetical protein
MHVMCQLTATNISPSPNESICAVNVCRDERGREGRHPGVLAVFRGSWVVFTCRYCPTFQRCRGEIVAVAVPVRTSDTPVNFCRTGRPDVPEDGHLYTYPVLDSAEVCISVV